jgi:hypothetical protein
MKRVLLCAALLAWSGMAGAVVYKWVDAQGKVLYGDRPPDGVHAEVVELLGSHSTHLAVPPTHAAGSSATGTQTLHSSPGDPIGPQDATKKAIDDDVAQSREKQCADAQTHYKQLIEGRRLYKTGPDGERQYLTSDEIDAERINAKNAVDTICNSTT